MSRNRPVGIAAVTALAVIAFAAPVRGAELDAISKAAAQFHGGAVEVGTMYSQCLLSTIRNDTIFAADATTYVITGDIGAMWLRDASAQVRPYVFFAADPEVKSMLRGVIAREGRELLADPYANAFNQDYKVAEEKFELDSLAYPIMLAWTYWKETGDASVFTPELKAAFEKAMGVMELERDHRDSRYRHRELPNDGAGSPTGYTGMVWTGFRPSDDVAQYGYNVPDEMFVVVALAELREIEASVWHDTDKQSEINALRDGIIDGINNYGIVYVPKYGYIYAYEVDGLGHSNLMDDANVPSLLSIPYLGYVSAQNEIYQNTRRFVLSADNPYYFTGSVARGVGSPHTPKGYVWPLALVMEGLTDDNPAVLTQVLAELRASDTGDHLLHESFDPSDPSRYTRPNFGWPCSLFSELIINRIIGLTPLPTAAYGAYAEAVPSGSKAALR